MEKKLTGNSFAVLSPLYVGHGVASGCAVEGGYSIRTDLQVARPDRDLGRICTHRKRYFVR